MLPTHHDHGGKKTAHHQRILKRRNVARLVPILALLCFLGPLYLVFNSKSDVTPSPHKLAPRKAYKTRHQLSDPRDPELIPASPLQNLVLVAGHAVYVGNDYRQASNESSWFLEEYQQIPGEAQSFLDHIKLGIEAAAADPQALLLFSGGQTRRAAGPRSEGLSYWVVAEAADWHGHPEVRNRTFTEEHARDSFENLLFSLCRFYELTNHYPRHVKVVSYTLKQQRFEGLHRTALRLPQDAFSFLGTALPEGATGAPAGEAATVDAFKKNPYGCTGMLLEKRLRRDPFAVGPPHPSRCPALRDLLAHCAPELFSGPLPWSRGDAAAQLLASDMELYLEEV